MKNGKSAWEARIGAGTTRQLRMDCSCIAYLSMRANERMVQTKATHRETRWRGM